MYKKALLLQIFSQKSRIIAQPCFSTILIINNLQIPVIKKTVILGYFRPKTGHFMGVKQSMGDSPYLPGCIVGGQCLPDQLGRVKTGFQTVTK
jgi:hypothetical protein